MLEQEKIIDELKEIGQKLDGKAMKWNPQLEFGHDYSKGEIEGWNDDEKPTQDYIDSVELDRQLREIPFKLRKDYNAKQLQMLLRTTICFKDIGKFHVPGSKKRLYGEDYSGNHIAIFECEMKPPPMLALIDHKEDDFFKAYRLNFKNWKIVDIDNYMQGNTFFDEVSDGTAMEAKANELFGKERSYLEDELNTDDPAYLQKYVVPMVMKRLNQIDMVDTKSNRNMSPLHKLKD